MSPSETHAMPPPAKNQPPRSVFLLARQQAAAASHPMRPPAPTTTLYSFPKPSHLKAKMREKERERDKGRIPISGGVDEDCDRDSLDEEVEDGILLLDSEPAAAPIPVPILTSTTSPSVGTFGMDARLDHLAFPLADDLDDPRTSKMHSPKRTSSHYSPHQLPPPPRTQTLKSPYPPHPLMRRDTSGHSKPDPRMLRLENMNPHKSARTTASRSGPIRIVGFDAGDDEEEATLVGEKESRKRWR